MPAQISHERNGFFGGLSTGAKTAARYAALTEAETSGAAVFTHNAQAWAFRGLPTFAQTSASVVPERKLKKTQFYQRPIQKSLAGISLKSPNFSSVIIIA